MYMFVISLILVSSVPAVPSQMKEDEPKPCCSPSSFTQDFYGATTTLEEGQLLEVLFKTFLAYDSIEEKISSSYHLDFTNGTEEYIRTIIDYKQNEAYTIFKEATGETCYKQTIETGFEYYCLPENAEYVHSTTLGDRALDVDVWEATEESDSVTTKVVIVHQKSECIPINYVYRTFDSQTDEQLDITTFHVSNFKLGICDKDVFHVPDACHQSVLSEKEPKLPKHMLKLRRLGLTRGLGFNFGKI
ncbi:uncharacterized protein [Asterias amurensis]|uniref:uncharacterized protein n=1 Tax=Asterias amurensis TaxID=7602 RepID=UPI003AB8CBE9